jgi:hypothetical protein
MNPSDEQISDEHDQERSGYDADLACEKVSDVGRQKDRPQRAVDDLDGDKNQPYGSGPSNDMALGGLEFVIIICKWWYGLYQPYVNSGRVDPEWLVSVSPRGVSVELWLLHFKLYPWRAIASCSNDLLARLQFRTISHLFLEWEGTVFSSRCSEVPSPIHELRSRIRDPDVKHFPI